MAPRVLTLVAGDIGHDSRVRRSARSLALNGFDVTVSVATTADGAPPLVAQDGYRVVQMPVVVPLDELRAVRLRAEDAHAEQAAIAARLNGSPPSAVQLERIAYLRREEGKLRRRAAFLADHGRASKRLDRPYRAPWIEVIRGEAPDVVHVHDHHGLGAAVKAAGSRTRLIFDAHEDALGKVAGGRRKALAIYLRRHVAMVDAVVTVGKEVGNVLARDLRMPRAPVVIHNAPSVRDRRPAPYDLRAAAGIDPESPLVVYPGSQSKRRALDAPIRALPGLPGVHLAYVFAVDKMSAQLADLAERRGVRDRVHFLPPVAPDAVVSLLAGADVAINPLRPHRNGDLAMPNKLFEYLHAVPVRRRRMPRDAGAHRRGSRRPAQASARGEAAGDVLDFDYASHVRYFANAKEVRKRYAAAVSELEVTPLPFGKHTLFLLDGITAGSAGPRGFRAGARRLAGRLRRRS